MEGVQPLLSCIYKAPFWIPNVLFKWLYDIYSYGSTNNVIHSFSSSPEVMWNLKYIIIVRTIGILEKICSLQHSLKLGLNSSG